MSQDYLDKLIEKDKAGTQIQSIPLHDTELRGITIDDPITVEGNPINFSTKNEQNAIQTVVDLEPIQDLHGYSKPWVGGAGKNLLPLTVEGIKEINTGSTWNDNSYTYNGVTFTILTDEDNNVIGIKAHGQNNGTAASLLRVAKYSIPSGSYILTSCPSGGSTTTYYADWRRDDGTQLIDTGNGVNYTSSNGQTDKYSQVIICVGYNAQNIIYSPILRKSTDPAGFEPYTNICPILPHEEIKIGGCGKNLLDSTTEKRTNPDTGATSDRYLFYDQYIPCKVGTYYFSCTTTLTTIYQANIALLDANKNRIDVISLSYPKLAGFAINITNVNTKYLKVTFYHSASISSYTFTNPQLEFGSEKTSYEPYQQSNSLTIPLPEDVYGGTLNLETGELVVEKTLILLKSDNIVNISFEGGDYSHVARIFTNLILEENNAYKTDGCCNKYTLASRYSDLLNNGKIGRNSSTNIILLHDDNLLTSSDIINSITEEPIQLVYPLLTPYTLQLTPAQLKLFKDVNNLNSSDYTTLTVTYHSNSIATLTPATDTTDGLLSAMDKHKLNIYDIADIGSDDGVTVEDNPLMITTHSDQHALSTKVSLAPIQDLHGFSKPWVGGAGKNLIPMTVEGIKSYNSSATWTGNSCEKNGVIFTILVDSDNNVIGIKANGTVSGGNAQLYIKKAIGLTSGDYIINGAISSNKRIFFYDGMTWYDDYGSGKSFTISSQATQEVAIVVANGTIINNEIFYPMVRLSTELNPTFEPYTNICSISGLDEIDILGCGKNLWDEEWESGSINGSTGLPFPNANYIRTKNFINILSTETYYLLSLINTVSFALYYDEDNNYIGTSAQAIYANNSFIPNVTNAAKVKFVFTQSTYNETNRRALLLDSETDKTYEPYKQSNNLSLPLPETVYGGELDLESGKLRVDRTIYDMGNMTYQYLQDNTAFRSAGYLPGATSENIFIDSISSCYKENQVGMANMSNGDFRVQGGLIYLKDFRYTSASDLKTAVTGQKLVYELADSYKYTIHLTPEQLTLFKDINHISTNAKSISVTYREGKLAINSPATDTKDGLLSAIDKRALDRTEEIVEGNPIAFETESAQVAKSTIVDLEPIQDLHGYSKPWVGGAGKNKLPLTVDYLKSINTGGTWSGNAYTLNNVVFTVLTDSDDNVIGINVNGTASSDIWNFVLGSVYCNANTQYILNGCPSGKSESTEFLQTTKEIIGSGDNHSDIGSGVTFSTTESKLIYIRIVVKSGYNTNNSIFYPMIRLASVADATFEPYTNIASISGRSEVYILGCGKNLWNDEIVTKDSNITKNGHVYEFAGISSGTQNIQILKTFVKSETYTISFEAKAETNGTILYFDGRPDGIVGLGWDKGVTLSTNYATYSFTDLVDTTYTGLRFYRTSSHAGASSKIYLRNIQLERSNMRTPYSPYQESNSLQIKLGQTVYGGQLDVENGVLVVDKASVDLGDLDWVDLGTAVSGAARFKTTLTNKPVRSDLTNGSTSYCSHYDLLTDGATYTANKDGYTISTTDIVFFVDAYKTSSTSAFKTAMSGVQVVYTLQDEYKTTISLTPEQVRLLQGVNTITTNADNITLTYRNGSVATLNDLESLYAKLKAYIDSLHSS